MILIEKTGDAIKISGITSETIQFFKNSWPKITVSGNFLILEIGISHLKNKPYKYNFNEIEIDGTLVNKDNIVDLLTKLFEGGNTPPPEVSSSYDFSYDLSFTS